MKRNRNIPLKVRFRICREPCAVCGVPYDIKCDHIIPFSKGGANTEDNLQPLCHQCNHAKHNRRTNEQLIERVKKIGLEHFLRAVYLWDTRFLNYYDGPNFELWKRELCPPERRQHAKDLYQAFLSRVE